MATLDEPALSASFESGAGEQRADTAAAWHAGLEVRHLRTLVALADLGSMTAAARHLGIAQSTVSETVAALERVLGTPAVERAGGSRGVGLTAAGRALLPHARRVLTALREAEAAVASASREARSSVEVIANESLTTYLLPPALALVRRQWPRAHFTVTVATCTEVRAGVAAGRYDLGFALLGSRTPRHKPHAPASTLLAEVRLALFAGPGHPLLARPRQEVGRERLAPYTVFSSDASGHFHAMLERFFAAGPGAGPRLESVGSVEAVKRSVEADAAALGVLPAYALAEQFASRTLFAVPLRPPLPRLRLEALVGSGEPANPAGGDLIEAMRSVLAGHAGAGRSRRR